MVSEPHNQTEVLMGHFLDPQRPWNAAADAELRALIEEHEDARQLHGEMIILHRLLVGHDAEEPTGFEKRRRLDALLDATSEPPEQPSESFQWFGIRFWSAMGTLAAAAIAMVMLWPSMDMLEDTDIRSRGNDGATLNQPLVGLGISGVTESGDEYEVVASNEAGLGDYFRFYYTNESELIRHLFIFGLQEKGPVIWYAPLPPEETESLSIGLGRSVKLPLENRLAARHQPGKLKVVALFTQASIQSETIHKNVNAGLWDLDENALVHELTRRLRLASEDKIQVLETRVVSRHEEEVKNESH